MCRELNKRLKVFKGYHYVSLNSLVDSNFDRYAIHWMELLKVIIPNTVFAVPKFLKLPMKIILLLNYTKNLRNFLINTWRTICLQNMSRNIAVYQKKENWNSCVYYKYFHGTKIKYWVVCSMVHSIVGRIYVSLYYFGLKMKQPQ